jgi:hypothetical protein
MVPAAKADENLKSLLHELMSPRSDGIGLLVYCVRGMRARRALIRNYDLFNSAICRKKVSIVVVTRLENEPDMESWWGANGKEFTQASQTSSPVASKSLPTLCAALSSITAQFEWSTTAGSSNPSQLCET